MATAVNTGWERRTGWHRLTRGLHVLGEPTLIEELRAWQLVLPEESAFTHLSAAALYRWRLPEPVLSRPAPPLAADRRRTVPDSGVLDAAVPEPTGLEPAVPHPAVPDPAVPARVIREAVPRPTPSQPVFVALPHDGFRPRRPGALASRLCQFPAPVLIDGCRVVLPEEALLAAARDLGVLDLAVMADSALQAGHCTREGLAAVARPKRPGSRRLRTVLPLLDARSESAWESILRVLHHAAEIPVEPQYVIHDGAGLFVARADLRVVGTRRLHEYDGAVHRTPQQQTADLDRDRRLVNAGWQRIGFTAATLTRHGGAIVRETDAALGRDFRPQRVARWNQLLAESTLTPRGRARIAARWRRALPPPQS
ncbi:MAG TPA: hypothetical protein VFI30_07750 [Nocardioidaceae bacterium]|nr:hypothetical protein [Nocardioidaceae bacterium]